MRLYIYKSLVSAVFESPCSTSSYLYMRSNSLFWARSSRRISCWFLSSSLSAEFLACAIPIWITAPTVSFSALMMLTYCRWYLSSLTMSKRTFSSSSKLPLSVIVSLSLAIVDVCRRLSRLSLLLSVFLSSKSSCFSIVWRIDGKIGRSLEAPGMLILLAMLLFLKPTSAEPLK